MQRIADAMSGSSIFKLLRVLVIESDCISNDEAESISKTLKDNGALDCFVYKNSNDAHNHFTKRQFLDEFTQPIHCIVSKTTNFPFYALAAFDFLIPVVTPSWIEHCLKFKRLMRTTCYSPNDKHFLKDCYIYVSKHSLNMIEYQLYCAIIISLGGTCMDYLSTKATHIITWNQHDLAIKAMQKFEKYKVKFLVPNWLVDCLCQMELVDETEYLIDVSKEQRDVDDKIGQLWDKTLSQIDLWRPPSTFRLNKRVILGDDLTLPGPCYKFFLNWVKKCLGGSIVLGSDFEQVSSEVADIYIGYSSSTISSDAIERKGLLPANILWVFYIWQIGEIVDPRSKLLLSPFKKPIFTKDELKVTFTNYYGEQRYYIQQLTEALGGVCSTELTKKNTHLISSLPSGKKFQAAESWDCCTTVNHLWLESCYKFGKKLSTQETAFQEFPIRAGLLKSLGQMPLEDNLESFTENTTQKGNIININENENEGKDKNEDNLEKKDLILEPAPFKAQPEIQPEDNSDVQKIPMTPFVSGQNGEKETTRSEIVDVQSNIGHEHHNEMTSEVDNAVKTKILLEEMEAEIDDQKQNIDMVNPALPSRTNSLTPNIGLTDDSNPSSAKKRKAKENAESKLQKDMESLNEYQRGSKRKRTPDFLPEELTEIKKQKSLDLKAEKIISNLSLPQKPFRIKAVLTQCHENLSELDLALLSKVGVVITMEVESNTNTIIAPKKSRTAKFLKSLSLKPLKYALKPSFISDILSNINKGRWIDLDIKKYYIPDIDPDVLKRTKLPTKVFERIGITHANLSDDIPGGFDLVSSILKYHGMKKVSPIKKKITIDDIVENIDENSSIDYILIATKASMAKKFSNCIKTADPGKRIFVVEWNWCVKTIFNLDIDMSDGEYVIFNK